MTRLLSILRENFLGREVSSIVLVCDYVQLWFQPNNDNRPSLLDIYSQIAVNIGDRTCTFDSISVRTLRDFIGTSVIELAVDDENFILSFSDGNKICMKKTGDEQGFVGAIDGADF